MTVTSGPPETSVGDFRLRRLARLADALSDAVTVDEAATAVATASAQEMAADLVAVCLLSTDGSTFLLAASDGMHPDLGTTWASFPADAPVPVVDAVRDRQMVLVDGSEERERRYPVLRQAPIDSETLVIAPMLVHEETVIGALSFGFRQRRSLDELDRAFIQAAADLGGQAIHRAKLFEYQQRALARQRFLGHAATLLAAELDHDRTLTRIAQLAVAELADVCAVCLFDDKQILRPVTAVHRDDQGQQTVDQLVARQPAIRNPRLLEVARTGQTLFMPVIGEEGEAGAEDEGHRQLIRALEASSAIIVPLRARGHVVGVLLLLQTAGSMTLDQDDRQMAEELGSWAALALDNARLYAEQIELVEHLQIALAGHRAIEQAKGMLAARLDVSPTEAFNRMRRQARSQRRKIEEVADEVVAGRDDLAGLDS